MQSMIEYLKEIYQSCNIPFNVYKDDELLVFNNNMEVLGTLIQNTFFIGKSKFIVEINEKHSDLLKLIEFCIKNKYKETYDNKEKIIIDLLSNNLINKEKIRELPYLENLTYMIIVNLYEKNDEAINTLKDIYNDTESIILKYEENIIIVGIFDEIEEHVSSINETINTDVYEKCYICYSKIDSFEKLCDIYIKSINKINIGKKYKILNSVYNENSLLFEEMLENLTDDVKNKINNSFKDAFIQMDEDMIKTIEIFLKLDLNLSEAAKQLYVHRNTLIYRLDKIEKYTTYDIRKFNDACLFKVAFSIWKQKYE